MRECAVVLGSCIFRESREKSESTIRLAGKGWKPSGGKCLFSLVSQGMLTEDGEAHTDTTSLIYTPVFAS